MFSWTGKSPHSGAGVNVLVTTSTLELKVWTRLEENDFEKEEEEEMTKVLAQTRRSLVTRKAQRK